MATILMPPGSHQRARGRGVMPSSHHHVHKATGLALAPGEVRGIMLPPSNGGSAVGGSCSSSRTLALQHRCAPKTGPGGWGRRPHVLRFLHQREGALVKSGGVVESPASLCAGQQPIAHRHPAGRPAILSGLVESSYQRHTTTPPPPAAGQEAPHTREATLPQAPRSTRPTIHTSRASVPTFQPPDGPGAAAP